MKHGIWRYNQGCRCEICVEANRARQRAQKERKYQARGSGPRQIRKTAEHGTYTMYVRGCRCDPCREATLVYQREYRARAIGQKWITHGNHGRALGCTCFLCMEARRQYQRAHPRSRAKQAVTTEVHDGQAPTSA